MPTIREVLGNDYLTYKSQGVNDDEIRSIAKARYKNPPQKQPIELTPKPQDITTREIPEWLKGETDSGIINFGQDVLRGSTKTALNYYNLYEKATGGDTSKPTALLQKLDTITEEHKAKNRTSQRQTEVDALNENYANANTFSEKFSAGVDTLWDTITTPSEYQVGEFVGENADLINFFPVGKGLAKGAAIGSSLNASQAGLFATARDDKSGLDVAVESALGGTAGGLLGGATGHFTKKGSTVKPKDSSKLPNVDEAGVDVIPVTKIDKDGMIIDPFETGDKSIRVTPLEFTETLVNQKSQAEFSQVFVNENARVLEMDAKIKALGIEMKTRGATPQEFQAEVAKQFPPSNEAVVISNILNDGQDMDMRINGMNARQAVVNSIENSIKTPEEFYRSMVGYGATHEHANAATRAYETKNIAHYTKWSLQKLAASKEMLIDMDTIKAEAVDSVAKKMGTAFDIQKISNSNLNDIETHLGQLKKHERYSEVLDFTRDIEAKDSVNPQKLDQLKKVTTVDTAAEFKTTVESPTYVQNYSHDFTLTKAKVKRIEDGKATVGDLEDLQRDLKMMEENPTYAKTPHYVLEEQIEADAMFGRDGDVPSDHGPILYEHRGDYKAAKDALVELQDGEAIGALYHKNIGPIDLVWGKEGTGKSDGYGLAKLVKHHPEVVDNLDNIVADMDIVKSSPNRIVLESKDHTAVVSLNWLDKEKTWLLTSYEDEKVPAHSSIGSVNTREELTTSSDTHNDSITQNDKNGDNISKSYQIDSEKISKDTEIYVGKDADGNDIMAKYGDIEAEYDIEAAMIKRIEDCIL